MDIAEHLFHRRAPNLPPAALANIFGYLIWATDDNGAEIMDTMCRWIASGNLEQARIALAVSEVFLYRSRQEMITAFDRLCSRFPELRPPCDEYILRWDQQHKVQNG